MDSQPLNAVQDGPLQNGLLSGKMAALHDLQPPMRSRPARDVRAGRRNPPRPEGTNLVLILIVAGGPDKGRIYELHDDQPVILGREGDQIKLNDRKCSRKHAKLWAEGGKWYVRDLNSRHGTHVNATQVENKLELHDGDHIQLGSTLFVLARLTGDNAERLALLGNDTPEPLPLNEGKGRQRLLVGGGMAAAATLVVGSNLFLYFGLQSQLEDTRQAAQQTQKQVAEQLEGEQVAAADEKTTQTLQQILDSVQAQRKQEQLLTQIAEAVKAQPEQAATLREILAKLEAQPESTAKTQEMLASVLEKVDGAAQAASVEPLVDEVRKIGEAARQQQQALAERAEAQDAMLREALAVAKTEPADDTANGELLKQILANLEGQKTLAADVRELRTLVEAQPKATQAVVREIVSSLPAESGDSEAVLAAIAELRESLPSDVTGKVDEVLARLGGETEDEATMDRVASALRAAIDEQHTATATAIAGLSAKIDEQRQAVERFNTGEILAALERATAPNAELMAKLDGVQQRLDALPTTPESAELRETLAAVLTEVRDRGPIDQLRDDVAKLAEAQQIAPQAALEQVLAAAKTNGDADAKLAEMHELIKAWPEQTEAMLGEMVEALAQQQDPNAVALDGVLKDIRQRAMARLDELDSAIRNDIRSGLAAELSDAEPEAAPVAGQRPTRSAVLATPTPPAQRDADGFSTTERAYKMAFETGQPVTIGAGAVDAKTGRVSEGRTLDPVAAKSAGMKDWRQWYMHDDFAERMRMQKQALRYTGDASREGVITLPSNVSAAPAIDEKSTPADVSDSD